MEEQEIGEVGVDKVGEHAVEHGKAHAHRVPWMRWLALTTAIFAVVAAVGSLKSGSHANEALISQARATDQWAYYQSKGNKSVTREVERELLEAMHGAPDAVSKAKDESERYAREQEEIKKEAKALEEEAHHHLDLHERFAYSVTLLQVAIGLSAVAALLERRAIWLAATAAGIAGIVLFLWSFLGS